MCREPFLMKQPFDLTREKQCQIPVDRRQQVRDEKKMKVAVKTAINFVNSFPIVDKH